MARSVDTNAQPDGGYRIRLAPKNEGIEYRDQHGVHRFNVAREGRVWILHLPGSKGDAYEPHELTAEEEARIVPRVTSYLSDIRWLGVFRRTYSVRLQRDTN
jgi:hypothetical protein